MMSKVSQTFGVLALSAASAVYAQETTASEQVCAQDDRSFAITEDQGRITGHFHQNGQRVSSETLASFPRGGPTLGTRSGGVSGNPKTAGIKKAFGWNDQGQAALPSDAERVEALRTRGKIFCYTGHIPKAAPGSFVTIPTAD